MKKLLVLLSLIAVGCSGPKIEVPAKVETTQCIQGTDGKCTSDINVHHTISIELPIVLTDSCRQTWNETTYPDEAIRVAGYNACVSDYINSLQQLVNSIQPTDLPQNVTLPGI